MESKDKSKIVLDYDFQTGQVIEHPRSDIIVLNTTAKMNAK